MVDDDDQDDEDDGGEDDTDVPTAGVSVLERADYAVMDEAKVVDAARRAHLRVWPDDDAAAAEADVTHLGRALFQLAHADGWQILDRTEGLRLTGIVVLVRQQDELLGRDPDDWPATLFDDDAELLFEERDAFGG